MPRVCCINLDIAERLRLIVFFTMNKVLIQPYSINILKIKLLKKKVDMLVSPYLSIYFNLVYFDSVPSSLSQGLGIMINVVMITID